MSIMMKRRRKMSHLLPLHPKRPKRLSLHRQNRRRIR
jgi:hypothetical protein